jgi:20S proteasome subunit alpha 6
LDDLVVHGLRALRETLHQDKELNSLNVSIAIVGPDLPFRVCSADSSKQWLDKLDTGVAVAGDSGMEVDTAAAAAAPMETE